MKCHDTVCTHTVDLNTTNKDIHCMCGCAQAHTPHSTRVYLKTCNIPRNIHLHSTGTAHTSMHTSCTALSGLMLKHYIIYWQKYRSIIIYYIGLKAVSVDNVIAANESH